MTSLTSYHCVHIIVMKSALIFFNDFICVSNVFIFVIFDLIKLFLFLIEVASFCHTHCIKLLLDCSV